MNAGVAKDLERCWPESVNSVRVLKDRMIVKLS